MIDQACSSSGLLRLRRTLRVFALALLPAFLFSACGGGYDGGAKFEAPEPSPSPDPAPAPTPEPTPLPTPLPGDVSVRKMEALDRGVVAIPSSSGVSVSWRLLGTDPVNTSFEVFRDGEKITASPLTQSTFLVDPQGTASSSYSVSVLVDGAETESTESIPVWADSFLRIPLDKPMDRKIDDVDYGYIANDASAADLNGDGQYEIILKWEPSNSKDNSQAGVTGNVLIDAYALEGERLWRVDLGPNIRAGAHYTQFIAYDFDNDGRAEVAMKTADGTIDGRGTVIGDAEALYRNSDGYILDGPEFLTMFDGLSGEALDTIDYVPARGNVNDWGDNYGNRVDRFLAGLAYLDGENPSLLMARGYYTRAVVAAYDWTDGAFVSRWVFDTNNGGGDEVVYGQGAHSLTIGDVDADGRDEIIYGAAAIDDDGHALYSTNLGHGDAQHLGDLDPNRPGMEIFMVHECGPCYRNEEEGYDHGVEMHDAATGEILWSLPGNGDDVGRGVSLDIDPRYPGNESWGSRGGLTAADGTAISEERPSQMNFGVWWDGDLLREILDNTYVSKWNYLGSEDYVMLRADNDGAVSNNGTKATPTLSADLLGDWREEIVWAHSSGEYLMLYSTPHDTDVRIPTLMHDSQYRTAIAWQNVGYNQPPHPSFFLGHGMAARGVAAINPNNSAEWVKLVANGDDDKVTVQLYSSNVTFDTAILYRDTDQDPEGRTEVARLAAGTTSYVDEGVVPDVTYYYWVELEGSAATVSEADLQSKTTLTSTLLPSYDVNAISAQGPVKLLWETVSIERSRIAIYRADNLSPEDEPDFASRTLVGEAPIDADEWSDETSEPGMAYYYWVEFEDDTAGVIHTPEPVWAENIPVPVMELNVAYVDSAIEVSWRLEDYRPDIASVEVYRNTDYTHSGRTRVLRSAPTEGTFVDNNPWISASDAGPAVPGTRYWYTLKVVLADGSRPDIPLLPEEGIEIPEGGGAPIIGAWAESVGDPAELQVGWRHSSIDATAYTIYRDVNEDGSGRSEVASIDAGVESWVDESAVPGTTYYYWVVAEDADTNEYEAATAGITIAPPPSTSLSTAVDGATIVVSWDLQNFPQEVTGVQLYRNTTNELGGRVRVSPSGPTSGSFVDDGSVEPLVSGTRYWYMFKLTLADGSTYNTDPEADIVAP